MFVDTSTRVITVSLEDIGWAWSLPQCPILTKLWNIGNDAILTDLELISAQLPGASETIHALELDAKREAANFDVDHVISFDLTNLIIIHHRHFDCQCVTIETVGKALSHTDNLTLKN